MSAIKDIFTKSFLAFFLILSDTSIFGTTVNSWIEKDRFGNPVQLQWFPYNEFDDAIKKIHTEVIPLYARAAAPFEMEQIRSFRQLLPEEQDKRAKYKKIPEDITEENCIPFFEALLFREYHEKIESLPAALIAAQKYFVIAKGTDNIVLGFANFWVKDEEEWSVELEPLMIDPPAQGRGLARQLIFSIFKIRPDLHRITLCTNAKNRACEVYKHLGFKEISREKTPELEWEYGIGIVFEFVKH